MGRPKVRRWTAAEIDAFATRIEQLLDQLNWTPADLDLALRYASSGKMTAQILGLYGDGHRRQPSVPYVQKFAQLEANPPPRKPPWTPRVLPADRKNGQFVAHDKILSPARQCPMCVVEFGQGLRREADTWWWFGHPRQRYCSPAHKKLWYRWLRNARKKKADHDKR